MKKRLYLLLLLISMLSIGNIYAQQPKVDSLENLLKFHTTDDTAKVNLLNEIANSYFKNNFEKMQSYAIESGELADSLNFLTGKAKSLQLIGLSYLFSDKDKALTYSQNALKLANEINCKAVIISSLINMGQVSFLKNEFPKAIEFFQKALVVAEEINNKFEIANCIKSIAQSHLNLGDFEVAIKEYEKALIYYNELNNKSQIATVKINLGVIFMNQGNNPLALEYFQNALKTFEELNDKQGIGVCFYNIGNIYLSLSDYQKALDFNQKSLKIAEELNDKNRILNAWTQIGLIYQSMKDPKALECFQKALTISEELNEISSTIRSLNYIGNYYLKTGEYEKVLDCSQDALEKSNKIGFKSGTINALYCIGTVYLNQKKYDKALHYILKNLEIAKEMKLVTKQKELSLQLSKIYAATNDYKKAYIYNQLYKKLYDSIYNKENIRKIANLEYRYKYEKEKQAIELEQQRKDIIQAAQKKQQQLLMLSFIGAFILMSLLAFYIYRSYLDKKRSNILLTRQKEEIEVKNENLVLLNEEITAQREEISSQRDEIEAQRDMVVIQKDRIQAQKNVITDSIDYAKHIQQALLPSSEYTEANLKEHFILFKPKDIVSGDFYWSTRVNEYLIVTVADCTGHGIPGAFMSILGISFLNEIVGKKGVVKASDILDQLRNSVIDALKQKWRSGVQKDGIDLALIVVNTQTGHLQYAGAHNPLYIVSTNKELKQLRPDNQTVAINLKMTPFTNQEIQLNKGDSIYLASDGYHDQFGGPQKSKFKKAQLKELFVTIADKPMVEQGVILDSAFEHWKGKYEQTDDVTIVGMKF